MGKNSFQAAFKRLVITPEVCAMLGKTEGQIAKMDLRAFANLVYSKGYEVTVNSLDKRAEEGRLTITVDSGLTPTDTGGVT